MGLKLLHGARGAAGGIAAAAGHLAWYLAYCVDGSATRPRAEPGFEARTHLRRAS